MALALAARGRERRILVFSAFLSTSAIVISGTRGAWLGLLIGAVVFCGLEFAPKRQSLFKQKKKVWVYLGILVVLALSAFWIASSSRYSNTAWVRLLAIKEENFSGSGRTLLWRDSLKMVPRYALVGCGAEGYRKAFLAYRSKELAQLAPQINNESPHNAYLDALISSGLVGGLAYLLLVFSSLFLLIRARRQTKDEKLKIFASGLIAAIVAVAVHNFFIFDQITTGFYFFAFAALAQVVFNIASKSDEKPASDLPSQNQLLDAPTDIKKSIGQGLAYLCLAISVGLLSVSIWYSYRLVRLDMQLKMATPACSEADLDQLMQMEGFFDANDDVGRAH